MKMESRDAPRNNDRPRVLVFNNIKGPRGHYYDLVPFALSRAKFRPVEFNNQKYALEELGINGLIRALVVLSVNKKVPKQDIADDPFLIESAELSIPRAILSSIPSAELYVREEMDVIIQRLPKATLPDRVVGWVTSLDLK